ncbi:metallophosphoesterase family protein [Salinispira pacifica]|uniref:Diadenosine tetraphosphatase n=1 Tax=Salinispira pacifica TaxID=1307761 RepID=V5WHX1_9SPIO|nr:metallophosphoesterase family protein [Salinispira pacifica]AHC15398.1 Diadenosine tetraphosphatase [Salinispira pacifica]
MRYLLLSDIHGNLPAARAAIALAKELQADEIIHIGDSVSIGPQPSETLDYLSKHNVRLLKGNHEEYIYSEPPPAARMSQNEILHNDWLRKQLRADQIQLCREMPYIHRIGEGILLQHFVLDHTQQISTQRLDLRHDDLRQSFSTNGEQLVIFGHIHTPFQRTINSIPFISFGTSGCVMQNGLGKQALLLETEGDSYSCEEHSLNWDAAELRAELKKRRVPAADEVIDIFFNLAHTD